MIFQLQAGFVIWVNKPLASNLNITFMYMFINFLCIQTIFCLSVYTAYVCFVMGDNGVVWYGNRGQRNDNTTPTIFGNVNNDNFELCHRHLVVLINSRFFTILSEYFNWQKINESSSPYSRYIFHFWKLIVVQIGPTLWYIKVAYQPLWGLTNSVRQTSK